MCSVSQVDLCVSVENLPVWVRLRANIWDHDEAGNITESMYMIPDFVEILCAGIQRLLITNDNCVQGTAEIIRRTIAGKVACNLILNILALYPIGYSRFEVEILEVIAPILLVLLLWELPSWNVWVVWEGKVDSWGRLWRRGNSWWYIFNSLLFDLLRLKKLDRKSWKCFSNCICLKLDNTGFGHLILLGCRIRVGVILWDQVRMSFGCFQCFHLFNQLWIGL